MPIPTIVLLHGQPDSSASFWSLHRELRHRVGKAIQVVAPDRPGYGANPLPVTDYAGNVRWLKRWFQRINAGPVVVVGHSWAGGVAALAASGDAGPISGLVLLASIGPSCLLRIDPLLAAPVVGDAIAYSTLRLARPIIGHRAKGTIRQHLAPVDTPYAAASGMAMRHRPIWRSFVLEQRALIRELTTITRALPHISVPTQVIAATRDTTIPGVTGHLLVDAIPNASLVDIEGGHDLQLRRPVQVAASIVPFATPLLAQQ